MDFTMNRMGDGLHYESDGKWIVREYNRLAKILVPELKEIDQKKRKEKAVWTDEQIKRLVAIKKCKCGGELKQKRSGTKVVYCQVCNARYIARTKK